MKNKLLLHLDYLDSICYQSGMFSSEDEKDYKDKLEELQAFINKDDGFYNVQQVSIYDVQQAVGDDTIEYSNKEMKALANVLEEETYHGDEWCDIINEFHAQLTA